MSTDAHRLAGLRLDWRRLAGWRERSSAPDARLRHSLALEQIEADGLRLAEQIRRADELREIADFYRLREAQPSSSRAEWRTIKARSTWGCWTCGETIEHGEEHHARTYSAPGEGRVTERMCESCDRQPTRDMRHTAYAGEPV